MAAIDTLSRTALRDSILTVRGVSRGFARGSGEVRVLADVDLSLYSGEIVGLLGRSGSGKSTLLRIIAGLIRPSGGEVIYRGQPVGGPADGIAMVFQTFALFPWLTVLQNVEAGLEAQGVGARERRQRALAALAGAHTLGFEAGFHVLQNGEPREQREGLEHHRHTLGGTVERLAKVRDPAVGRLDQAGNDTQERRLPRARPAQHADN